jgi:predicted nuclease of predicted toxin-antitoxin system
VTLLFDENVSFRLLSSVRDRFPKSLHVRDVGLAQADDRTIWQYARDHGFAIVTLDSDFYDMSLIHSSPPKVVWLRSADTSTTNLRAAGSTSRGYRDVPSGCDERVPHPSGWMSRMNLPSLSA